MKGRAACFFLRFLVKSNLETWLSFNFSLKALKAVLGPLSCKSLYISLKLYSTSPPCSSVRAAFELESNAVPISTERLFSSTRKRIERLKVPSGACQCPRSYPAGRWFGACPGAEGVLRVFMERCAAPLTYAPHRFNALISPRFAAFRTASASNLAFFNESVCLDNNGDLNNTGFAENFGINYPAFNLRRGEDGSS